MGIPMGIPMGQDMQRVPELYRSNKKSRMPPYRESRAHAEAKHLTTLLFHTVDTTLKEG